MPHLWIKAEPSPGCDIRESARLAVELAGRASVGVKLRFNGVEVLVKRSTTVEEVVYDYRRKLAEAQFEPDEEDDP